MWLTDGVDAAPEFNIDLGSVHTVDQLRVWNYNENANATCCLDRGVKTADIYVAGADGVFGAAPVISGQSFARAPGATEDFSEVISLGGVQARYIKIDVTENHGDASFTDSGQLLQNLVGNALKFRASSPRIEIEATRSGADCVFRVSDNGIGIDPQFAGRIFQMFQRLHGRELYPGSGIGLAIAKRIVERHDGEIWLDTSASLGTTFCFTLKAADPG